MSKKKKQESEETGEQSIGSQMQSDKSARSRNLAIKAKLIEDGKHPEPKFAPGTTQRDRNLILKKELRDGKAKE